MRNWSHPPLSGALPIGEEMGSLMRIRNLIRNAELASLCVKTFHGTSLASRISVAIGLKKLRGTGCHKKKAQGLSRPMRA